MLSLIRIGLRLDGPWAVGSINDWRSGAALPVLADPRAGRRSAYLPATSLAGSLREHLGSEAEKWLGPEPAEEKAPRVRSPLRFLGVLLLGDNMIAEATTTAIDGRRRAALAGSLRTAERIESPSVSTTARVCAMIDRAVNVADLDQLQTWSPFVGRGRSVGLGAAHVQEVEAVVLDLEGEDLAWWLTRRDEWFGGQRAGMHDSRILNPAKARGEQATCAPPAGASLTFAFRAAERVAVGAEGHEELILRSGKRSPKPRAVRVSAGRPVVPGTAWKGIFRHRCEHILRAVNCPDEQARAIIEGLFGSSPGTEHGQRGMLRFSDGYLTAPDGSTPAPVAERKHVAIDRFTGGALGGGHFAVRAVERGSLVTCRIDTDQELPQPLADLLRWVAYDIHDGLVGVGGLTSRGYGTLALVHERDVSGLAPMDPDLLGRAIDRLGQPDHGGTHD